MYKGKKVIIGRRPWWKNPIFPWGLYSLTQDKIETSSVKVDGYYIAGDGGGGLFMPAEEFHEDNGGAVIKPENVSGRYLKQYDDLAGDGQTDDTDAAQAIMDGK